MYIKPISTLFESISTLSYIYFNMSYIGNISNYQGIKSQESSDPIDQYVKEHSLRLTSEQNEIIEYTSSLPGYYSLF